MLSPDVGWIPRVIEDSPDLRRIKALPVRDWTSDPELPQAIQILTDLLTTDLGKREGNRYDPALPSELEPVQAATLCELMEHRGAVCPQLPGAGKSLSCFLPGTLLQLQRVMLVVPAALHTRKQRETKSKTLRDLRRYAKHWRVHPPITYTYEELRRKGGAAKIAAARPQLVILDECQNAGSDTAAWAKIRRWLTENSDCMLMALSASMHSRDLTDYSHLVVAALRERAPVPVDIRTLVSWRYALGEKIRDEQRLEPSPLIELAPAAVMREHVADSSFDALDLARIAYGWRFTSSPGIVATVHDRPANGLEIDLRQAETPAAVAAAISKIKNDHETPDGYPVLFDIEIYAKEVQLEQGWHMIWDPPAPAEYRTAKRDLCALIRDVLDHSRTLDTPEQVTDLIRAGQVMGGEKILASWEAWNAEFKPNDVPVWIDDTAMSLAIEWLEKEAGKTGIVWVDFPHTGLALEKLTGLPYFRKGGYNTAGDQHIEKCKTSCVASIRSNGTGVNIHHHYDRSYHLGWQTTGADCEQTLGRTHRDGQRTDVVQVVVPVLTPVRVRALSQSIADAKAITYQSRVPQKLWYASYIGTTIEDLLASS